MWLGFITSEENPPISIPGREMPGKLEGLFQTCTVGGQSDRGWGTRRHGEDMRSEQVDTGVMLWP